MWDQLQSLEDRWFLQIWFLYTNGTLPHFWKIGEILLQFWSLNFLIYFTVTMDKSKQSPRSKTGFLSSSISIKSFFCDICAIKTIFYGYQYTATLFFQYFDLQYSSKDSLRGMHTLSHMGSFCSTSSCSCFWLEVRTEQTSKCIWICKINPMITLKVFTK